MSEKRESQLVRHLKKTNSRKPPSLQKKQPQNKVHIMADVELGREIARADLMRELTLRDLAKEHGRKRRDRRIDEGGSIQRTAVFQAENPQINPSELNQQRDHIPRTSLMEEIRRVFRAAGGAKKGGSSGGLKTEL